LPGSRQASAIALFLCGAGYAVVLEDPHRPEEEPRARGTPGIQKDPRASTPRDIEACRSPCASPFALVRARCFEACSAPSPVVCRSREGETCCVTFHRSGPRRSAARSCDGSLPPTGHHEPPACDGTPGSSTAWAAGPSHRISDAKVITPATAPRPASGDADQTPLGNGAG
jgi:hypothetical protein